MTSDTQVYPVGNATTVTLEAIYGDAQPGSTTTTWQGTVSNVPHGGSSYGNGGGPLQGSILFCKSSVLDQNPNTNHTCVTYRLSGGPETKEYYYEITVPDQGSLAEYAINFVFV